MNNTIESTTALINDVDIWMNINELECIVVGTNQQHIYSEIIEAMQPLEEMGGCDDVEDYVTCLTAVMLECKRRMKIAITNK